MERNVALEMVKAGTMTNEELLAFARKSGDQYVWEAVAKKLNLTDLTSDQLLELKSKTYNQQVLRVIDAAMKQ